MIYSASFDYFYTRYLLNLLLFEARMTNKKTSKYLAALTAALSLPTSLHAFTIKNIDETRAIQLKKNTSPRRTNFEGALFLDHGESAQAEPDWGDALANDYPHPSEDFGTTKVDFWVPQAGNKVGLNTLEIGDFRNKKGAKILMNPKTMAYVLFNPDSQKVEYMLEWQDNGATKQRASAGFPKPAAAPAAPAAPRPSAGAEQKELKEQKETKKAESKENERAEISRSAGSELPAAPGGPREAMPAAPGGPQSAPGYESGCRAYGQ